MAETLLHKGEVDKAIELLHEALHLNPNVQYSRLFLAMCLIGKGETEQARQLLDEKAIAFAEADGDGAYWLGSVYAMLGEKEEAIEWLQRAIRIGYENYPWFEADANLNSLRQESRFQKILNGLQMRWERLQQKA
ncbi:MAG: tetratricopeptide repeat protein [Acidobacteria bacterium]|nr:tetratricopeptide repeat protein [Acidobacteriota bacterium]